MSDEIQEEQVPAAPSPEPAPQPSREQLIGALAEDLGWRPEEVAGAFQLRSEFERSKAEYDRRMQALQEKERQIEEERERQRFQIHQNEYTDPNTRVLYEMMMEERSERRREREERRKAEETAREADRMAGELVTAYENVIRTVPTHQQVDQTKFFDMGMRSLYPEGIPAGMSPERAVQNTARYLGLQTATNGFFPPQTQPNLRDRRASITIPTGPAYQGGQVQPLMDPAPLDGETDEQRLDRLTKLARSQNMSILNLPEGRKFSSG